MAVMLIGQRGTFPERPGVHDLGQEDRVLADLVPVDDSGLDGGQRILEQEGATGHTLGVLHGGELVGVTPRLEPEGPDQLQRRVW